MAHQLLLLRHAKSDWQQPLADVERALSSRGRADAKRMGAYLAASDYRPACIVSSSAVRTRETVAILCGAFDGEKPTVSFSDDLYLADAETICAAAADALREYDRVMIVAHNPGMEAALLHYCPQATPFADGKLMPTCALAVIDVGDDGHGNALHLHTRPSEI